MWGGPRREFCPPFFVSLLYLCLMNNSSVNQSASLNTQILRLALPAIVTNITVPLLGLVDTSITGHLGKTAFIGAVSVGATLFNMIYWNFGFLRMGTSGRTAQAYGAKDNGACINTLLRALSFALVFTLLIWLLQIPVLHYAFRWMETTADVEMYARQYFSICIWGAPAILGMYCLKGWFIGMQNTKYPMFIAISINVVNILASLFLVYVMHLQVEGVACGTLISQYVGLLLALYLWHHSYGHLWKFRDNEKIFDRNELRSFFSLNGSIFLRTLCLNAVMAFFTFAGAHQGDVLLAVNVLLMQLFNIVSYFTDGFAYAGEALVGKFVGAKDKASMHLSIRLIFYWGGGLIVMFTLIYWVGAHPFLSLLTSDETVLRASSEFYPWVLLVPVMGCAAFLWDGIMVGATAIKPMVWATFLGCVAFFVLYVSLHVRLGNHALWLAFVSYLFIRGLVQTIWAKHHWYNQSDFMRD